MPIEIINVGTTTGDRTGDGARIAGQKINNNFNYLKELIDGVDGFTGQSIVPSSLATGTGVASWIAIQAGTYANFGGIVVSANSIAIISRSTAGVFSISQTTFATSNLQQVTTAGGTTDKGIIVDTTTSIAIIGKSQNQYGIYGSSVNNVAAVFELDSSSNVLDIAEFKKDGDIQASITHDGKVVANALNVAGNSTFNGVVTAPTATVGTNTTQLATTAFVQSNLAKKTYSITFSWDASTYAASASVYYVNRESKAITTPTFTTNNLTSGVPLPFNCKIIGITYAHNVLASTDLQMRVYKVLASTTAHTQVASKLISGNINVYAPTTDYNGAATFNCATETVSLGFLNPTISTGLWRSAAVTILFQEL